MLYLNANPQEYEKYHLWRKDPSLFERSYLERLQKRVAGPEELLIYKDHKMNRFPRSAQCCRLCDETFLEYATSSRTEDSLVYPTLRSPELNHLYLG